MGDIYRRCSVALIWLGDYDESFEKAALSIDLLYDDMKVRTNDFRNMKRAAVWARQPDIDDTRSTAILNAGLDMKAMRIFFDRPWFSRLWVCILTGLALRHQLC